ncbi:MAG: serine hydrolase [Bacteroidota bacterium]
MLDRRTFLHQLGYGSLGLTSLLKLSACSVDVATPLAGGLYTPESQGVSSQGLIDFLQAANESELEFHSIMINRNGKTILEGWWHPFDKSYIHTLYSLSKSFCATAIGMLQDDGKLSVEDQVISYFPDHLPTTVSDHLAAMRIYDLLTMHTGHTEGTLDAMRESEDGDWAKAFLSQDPPKAPGTHFMYNTGATYMLSAIVQAVSGQKLIDFLRPRLLEPLGIEGADWEECPKGINVGGYGFRVRTQDILNFGQLYLQKGYWKGKQLVSAKWIEEATKKQVESNENESDWGQGYGYQFWRCKPGCYRGDGAFGQFCIVVPEKDAVIVITSESKDMGASMKLVWDHILPAMKDHELKDELVASYENLFTLTSSLQLPILSQSVKENIQETIAGNQYHFEENDSGVERLSFRFSDDQCELLFLEKGKEASIKSGHQSWITADNHKAANALFSLPGRSPMPSRISSYYHWKDKQTLEVEMKSVDAIHSDIFIFSFQEKGLELSFSNSLSRMYEQADDRESVSATMR